MSDYPYEEEEFEDEIDEMNYKTQKDAILFAIHVTPSMLQAPPASQDRKKGDRDSPLLAAIKCAYHLIEQRIISNPKDKLGILFFGTELAKFDDDTQDAHSGTPLYPHCYLFTDLDIPSADDVRALKDLVEADGDSEEAKSILKPTTESVSMANVLFCANRIFSTRAANFGSRRLFLITNEDDPHPDNKQAKSAAAVRAKDLYDLGVLIELFPLVTKTAAGPASSFELAKFYDDIIYQDPSEINTSTSVSVSQAGDGLNLLKSLIANVNSRQTAKRALFSSLPFEIAPGLTISVKGYNVLQKQEPQRSCYIWLEGEAPQIAVGETTKLSEDSARTVDKADSKKAYKFGNEYVYFTPEEQAALKNFGPPCIRILGFKKLACLKPWMAVRKSTFIYPSEDAYVGSTRVFSALWQKLLSDGKFGVAWAITRANTKPGLFALLPTPPPSEEEESQEAGPIPSTTATLPAGLWLYPLPFADDLRGAPDGLGVPEKPHPDLVDKLATITEMLWLPNRVYDPAKYANPQLQWHYRILQALALQEEVPESPVDGTLPRYKAIMKRVGGYIAEFNEKLDEEFKSAGGGTAVSLPSRKASVGHASSAIKREADGGLDNREDEDPPRKRSRGLPSGDALTDKQLRAAIASGGVSKFTVPQLREILEAHGLATNGRKADLMERLEAWSDTA